MPRTVRNRSAFGAALMAGLLVAGCHRPAPEEPAVATNAAEEAPAPAPPVIENKPDPIAPVAKTAAPPPDAPVSADAQIQDDADATGMTARAHREDADASDDVTNAAER